MADLLAPRVYSWHSISKQMLSLFPHHLKTLGLQQRTIMKVLPPAFCRRSPGRRGGIILMALPVGPQFRSSLSLSPDSYHVTSWRVFVGCASLAALSLVSFNFLARGIEAAARAHGFSGPSAELLFLDLRYGYTPAEAWSLLERWAPEGRQQYLAVEAIDCLLYHPGYRGVGLVMINRLEAAFCQRWPSFSQAKYLAALPFLLASLDLFEDLSQVWVLLCMVSAGQPMCMPAAATHAPSCSCSGGPLYSISCCANADV